MAQRFRHRGKGRCGRGGQIPGQPPLCIGARSPAKGPGVSRIERVRFLDSRGGKGFPDWLEISRAMLLDQRLEEGHAQHLAFPFVDTWREILVHIIAEHMAVEKSTPTVRLHEE